jgi:hypothetical protein
MNETRTRVRVVVDTRFADLPSGLFDNCKIAVLMSGICFIEPDADLFVREDRSSEQWCQALRMCFSGSM